MPDGSLDHSFSRDGRQTLGADSAAARAVALQPDGKIVAAGGSAGRMMVGRLNPDGSVDPTFSDDGRTVTTFPGDPSGGAEGVVIQPNGKVVAVGYAISTNRSALARYDADGSLDATFSDDGLQTLEWGGSPSYAAVANPVALQNDGKLVVVAQAEANSGSRGSLPIPCRPGAPKHPGHSGTADADGGDERAGRVLEPRFGRDVRVPA